VEVGWTFALTLPPLLPDLNKFAKSFKNLFWPSIAYAEACDEILQQENFFPEITEFFVLIGP